MTLRLSLTDSQGINDAISLGMSGEGLLLTEQECTRALFDLRTGIAGELFQKFTNYQLPLAIVIADANVYGPRFSELVYEHRNHTLIRFFTSTIEAQAWLDRAKTG